MKVMTKTACQIKIEGVVQGVGFRPHVYRLAAAHGIAGWVLNSSEGVTIWAEGTEAQLEAFYRDLLARPPKLARIVSHCRTPRTPVPYTTFFIKHSEAGEHKDVLISPDVAICEDCRREIFDPGDRRYGYPFTNCTNCGPRFTIIMDVPYDRAKTTMREFPMCPDCAREYEDPGHRRFHAQPNACPDCGPQVWLQDRQGTRYPGLGQEFLRQGYILAVKGLGGFHLVCDAVNAGAVRELRRRKQREYKPFAVMCRDLDVVRRYCRVSAEEEELLTAAACPIVILDRHRLDDLPREISPGIKTLGVMLPYTPLHHLLFADDLDILIMTSANISDDPLIIDNDEALNKLEGIADYFLLHNRRIFNRCDDSVAAVVNGKPQIIRRARGYVPLPVDLPFAVRPVLACGGELKNTFCITKGNGAYPSQHLGDLNHFGNYRQFIETIPRFETMLDVKPEIVACDLHPDYMATRWARSLEDVKVVGVQHHHAHMASCMAENGLQEKVLGIICDGTGFGTDGTVWGFEFLVGDYREFDRMAHLSYQPLPGGDATVRNPERMALTYLYQLFGEEGLAAAGEFLSLSGLETRVVLQQIRNRINSIPTSSCGRLFDAVSALLGVCRVVRYEGQAAIELEAIIDPEAGVAPEATGSYPFTLRTETRPYVIDTKPMWQALLQDLRGGVSKGEMSARFHNTVVAMIGKTADVIRSETGINKAVLSGGVFQNRYLFDRTLACLNQAGFTVFYHSEIPANDGGISVGQALIANEVIKDVSGRSGENN